jgi:hypothetical protein
MDAAERIAKVLGIPVATLISGPPVRISWAERAARTELTCKKCGAVKPLAALYGSRRRGLAITGNVAS